MISTAKLQIIFYSTKQNTINNLASNKDVLKIEDMFCEIQQPDSYGRMQDVFVMNRDGFTLLAMGFTGKEALKFKMDYLEAFNKMETLLKFHAIS